MNILPIIPCLQNKNSAHNSTMLNNRVIQPKMTPSLNRDTVSFTGSTTKISDFIAKGVEENMPRLQRIATTYLDVLESVAAKLEKYGVSFDREYCELHPVKSPESYTSKIVRSGNFTVPDAIRATIYVKNPYDLSILNDGLLPEMKKRGYVLANAEMKMDEMLKRGYIPKPKENLNPAKTFRVPDLDIRLQDASENVSRLSPELRYSIGKPQKSGYEDIQMRFVREFDKKKAPTQHELIVLFGPNYSIAKHIESEKVYGNLREFEELHFKLDDMPSNPNSQKANRYIDLIKQMFRGKISEKLFLNAKNKDLYDLTDEIPINFNESDIQVFESYFSGLIDHLNACYKETRIAAKPSPSATKQINANARHDRVLIGKIRNNLRKTIDYFNHKNDLKKAAQ